MVDCEILREIEFPKFNISYPPPGYRTVGLVIDLAQFCINISLLIFSFILFVLTKQYLIPKNSSYYRFLEVRSTLLVFWVHVGVLIANFNGTLFLIVPFNSYPCWISSFTVFLPCLIAIPTVMRLFIFYRQHIISLQIAQITTRSKRVSIPDNNTISDETTSVATSSLSFHHIFRGIFLCLDNLKSVEKTREKRTFETIKLLRWLNSSKGTYIVFSLCVFPYVLALLAIIFSSPMCINNCSTCLYNRWSHAKYLLYFGAAFPIIFCIFGVYRVRKAADPLYILREIRFIYIFFGIPTLIFLVCDGLIGDPLADFSFRFIYQITLLCFAITQSLGPAVYCLYWGYCGNRLGGVNNVDHEEVTLSQREEFKICLDDPQLRQAFEQHLIAEHSVESLRFHDEVQKWSFEFHDMGERTAKIRAKRIVSLFVGDDAVYPVNLPGETIDKLRGAVGLLSTKSVSRLVKMQRGLGQSSRNTPNSRPLANSSTHIKQETSNKRLSAQKSNNAMIVAEPAPPNELEEKEKLDITFFDTADYEILELMRMDGFARFQNRAEYKELRANYRKTHPSMKKEEGNVI